MYKLGKFTEELRITSGSYHRFSNTDWHIAPLLVGETLMLLHVDRSVNFREDRFHDTFEKLSEIVKNIAVTDVFVVDTEDFCGDHRAQVCYQVGKESKWL